jgi:hypothetical protein
MLSKRKFIVNARNILLEKYSCLGNIVVLIHPNLLFV